MAILQCPSCGRSNPDFLDNCQYCGKALHLGDESGQPVAPAPEDADLPAWMRNTGDLPPIGAEAAGADEIPAWLRAATDELKSTPAASEESLPDWLQQVSKPLVQPSPGVEPEAADIPDWLKAMGATGNLQADASPAASGEIPDWLKAATGQLPATPPADIGAATGPITGPIEEGVPDWLKSMGATGPINAPVTPPAGGEPTGPIQEEVPDWLKGMGGTGAFVAPASPEPSPVADDSLPTADEMPDWLKAATGQLPATPPADIGAATGPITGPIEEGVPDWLKSMGVTGSINAPVTPPAGGEPTGPIQEEVPDWLKGMGGHGGTAPFTVAAVPEPAANREEPLAGEADLPDWLQSVTGQLPATPTPVGHIATGPVEEEVPDWLKSMGGTGPIAQPATPPTGEPTGAIQEETPDWLKPTGGRGNTQPFDISVTPESTSGVGLTPAGEAELPDWLRTATKTLPPAAELPPPAQPEPPKPNLQTGELPDWLKTATGPLEKPSAPIQTGELPDWLKAATGPLTPPTDLPPKPAGGELPDWLRTTGPLPPAVETSPEISAAPQPDWLSELEKSGDDLGLIGGGVVAADITLGAAAPAATPASDEPDWLRALQSGASVEAAQPAEPVSAEPNWLSELRGEPASEVPAAGEGEPDWMAALRPAPKAEPQTTYTPPSELTQGELPTWLSALRPVDAGAQHEPEQDAYQETVGVLSGMRGVLRAEPSVVLPGKTATRVHSVDASPEQNQQAAAFLKLLEADSQTTSTAPKKRLSLPWLRWLIASVLLVSMVAPLASKDFTGYFSTPIRSGTISIEVRDTFRTVENLSVSEPVLVAFEYEPGQQGEVGLLAEAVLSHLIRRGMRLVGISTSPTGAAVGQALLTKLAATPTLQPNPYLEADHYLNLGYLPGGPIGIAQFSRSPRSIIHRDFQGKAEVQITVNATPQTLAIWDLPLLKSIENLNGFGALMVITASPENARMWFEQTEAARSVAGERVPLIFVTSASAAPLVRPYFEADRQNNDENPQAGFISGPTAILEYEAQAGTAAEVSFQYWDMVGMGAVLAGVMLVLGNLIYGLRQLWRQQRGKAT